jgi:hypothetical protein
VGNERYPQQHRTHQVAISRKIIDIDNTAAGKCFKELQGSAHRDMIEGSQVSPKNCGYTEKY